MSAKIYGLDDYTPRADFRVRGTRQGGATASQTITMKRADWKPLVAQGVFTRGVTASSIDPNTASRGGDSLYLDNTETRDLPGGALLVRCLYAGWSAEYDEGTRDPDPLATYNKRSVLVQRSILEHPEVVALSGADRAICNGVLNNRDSWDFATGKLRYRYINANGVETYEDVATQPTAGAAAAWVAEITNGTATYDAVNVTWEKTWEDETGVSNAKEAYIGKVVSTPDGSPYTPAGTTWRLDEVIEMKVGELYRNRMLFSLSVPGGWNELIYDY